MYHRILVPMALDHGLSPQTLGVARTLLSEGGEIIALHVYEAPSGSVSSYLDAETVRAGYDRAQERLDEKLAGAEGVKGVLIKGHSARTIIDYAKGNSCDCIVIGSQKPGLTGFFLGSTAARVTRFAPCAVHVLRSSRHP
jgi:nucleotide-binding universal stress UspA family protein